MPNQVQALAGVRVLELTNYIAGPVAGRVMADLGAEVVKLEMPPWGDYSRGPAPASLAEPRYNPLYAFYNRGKQSICVDFKRPAGVALIKDLVKHFDVFVENLTPGLLAKYGLGYDDLSAVNPRLIMCSVSGFGQTGPLSKLPATDAIAQSMSGVAALTGDVSGMPVFSGVYIADGNAGMNAFGAVAAALFYREKTGVGQYIDLALSECIFHLHDNSLAEFLFSKGKVRPRAFGSHRNGPSPHGFYKTEDGYLIMVVLDHYWEQFTKAMGRPDLKDDPRFAALGARSHNRYILAEIVNEWIQKNFKTRNEAIKFLRDSGLIAAPVLTVAEAVEHPQLKERGVMETVEVGEFGAVPLPKVPWHMSKTPPKIPPKVAMLGEGNREVLAKYLGYSADQVSELLNDGVLVQDPAVA